MKKRNGFQVMAKLIGLVKPLSGRMALAVLLGLLGHLCAAFITIFGGYALLSILGFEAGPILPVFFPKDISGGTALLILFFSVGSFALLRGLLRYGEQALNHFIAFKLLALIRDKVFHALRRLCPAKLEGRGKGDLIAVITSDIELLEVFYAHTVSPVLIAALFTVIMSLFIGNFHPALGLLALGAYLAVGLGIPLLTSKISGDDGRNFREKSGELSGFVLDSLRGLNEILQYGQGNRRLLQMRERSAALSKDEERMKRTAGRNMALTNAVILLFDLSMLFGAALLYQEGVVDFAGVLIPTVALMSSFGPAVALAGLGSTLQNTFAAGNRVLDILEEAPVAEDISGHSKVGFSGAEAEHISFSYGEDLVLKNVSLTVPKHSVVGIVGRSGSGKSTLLKLFLRFWETQAGAVKVSGRDVNEINTDNLRKLESLVSQETHLFRDSIRNNLRIARLDATDREFWEACKKASVHDFIMSLPKGYDTQVGELGDTLSGGERQRLGLARAFLHDAPFLLLDEPTSNLDSLNEAVILKSLREERGSKTVVLVSHRQSTMRIADTVHSVEYGRVS